MDEPVVMAIISCSYKYTDIIILYHYEAINFKILVLLLLLLLSISISISSSSILVRKFSFYTFWVLLRNEFYPQWSLSHSS